MKLSKKYGGLQFFAAPAKGTFPIYNNEGTKVFDANAFGGDFPYTISLQENIVTIECNTARGVVYLDGDPSVNTENITITSEPSSAPTKTVISLPFSPTKIHFGSGTTETTIPTNYVEVTQGASVSVTEYGEHTGLYSGGGAVLQYFGTAATRISVDLATAFPDKWAALTIGKHTLQIRAKNPGNYLDSDLSTAIEFYKTVSITATATNCTAAASNPTVFPDVEGGDTILTFNKVTGYTLPETIVITGVAGQNTGYTWTVASDGQSAQLKILKALGDITVKVEGVVETYAITTNLTHATKESGPSTIAYGASATLVFAFPTGYEAPTDVTVTGATKSWTAGTATLVLSNPTGPVTVTVVGVATTTTLDGGTYKWLDSINLGEWTQNLNFTSNGTNYTGMQYTGDGTAMTLQYRYGGSEWVTVYNYNEDTSTGSWVNDAYKIVDLGTSAQTVTAIFKADFIANTTKLTQLATPQNVTADGTNVSWDEVENATSYVVIEGGNNVLGTVKTSFVLSARNTESLVNLKYKKDGTVTSSDYDGILKYSESRTNIEGIKNYITFGAFGIGDTMPIAHISGMVNCTAEQVSDEVAKLTLTGDATATLSPSD